MKQAAVKDLIFVEVRNTTLHGKLDLVCEEQDHREWDHDQPEVPSLPAFAETHVLPDILRWLLGPLDLDRLPKDLDARLVQELGSLVDVFIVLESNEDPTDVGVVLLHELLFDLKLKLKDVGLVGVLDCVSSIVKKVD